MKTNKKKNKQRGKNQPATIEAGQKDIKKKHSKTAERPKCDCDSTTHIYTQIGTLKPVNGRPLRIHIEVSSIVVCDPGTPGHCYYRYIAKAEVQRFRPGRQSSDPRRRRPATWRPYKRRKAFIHAFTVHDGVNKTEKPDRIDRKKLELGEWFPNAPKKEITKITLELSGSNRDKWRTTINRDIQLCVPKGGIPQCPQP